MCFFSKENVKGGSEAVRDALAGSARRSARQSSFGFVDFVADDAADDCTTDGSERAAARKHGPADGTDSSADGGVLILRRHAGTTT
jgi:hypothetical protein